MILSAVQIAQYAIAAGFHGQALVIAIAIALAESRGAPGAISTTGDYGLWQVNHGFWPQYSTSYLLTPDGSAQAAYTISNAGTNWRPWAAYNSGAYRMFLSQAQQAAQAASGATTTPPVIVASTAPNGAVTVAAIGVIAGIAYLAFG